MEPILPNEKTKGEKEADRRLSNKVSSKQKLKQSDGADLVVLSPTPAPVILTKKRGLDNLDVP